jgi:hypothetical protein
MRILKFHEANLNLGELEKSSEEGGLRGDVLVRKLKQQVEDSENVDGHLNFLPKDSKPKKSAINNPEDIINGITDGSKKSYDIEKAKDFLFRGNRYKEIFNTDDKVYKLNDIEKTAEFGSSGGSSLGSKETRIVESIQCLYCALRQDLRRNITDKDYDLLFDILGYIREELLDIIKTEVYLSPEILENYRKNWSTTFVTTANALYEYREIYTSKGGKKSILDDRKRYVFHQVGFTGGIMSTIKKKFVELARGMQPAKWNPSDMWIVNSIKIQELLSDIEGCQTIEELNKLVDENFMRRDIVSVSLKKVRNLESANLLINKVTERPRYSFLKVRTSFKATNSLGVNILMNQKSDLESENRDIMMVVRTFGGKEKIQDVQGEVLGKTSRHGKISLIEINSIFSKVSQEYKIEIPPIPNHKYFESLSEDELNTQVEILNDAIGKLGDKSKEIKTDKLGTKTRLISKLQALLIAKNLYYFVQASDRMCQLMMYYALAIENSQFVCPMYVRVL